VHRVANGDNAPWNDMVPLARFARKEEAFLEAIKGVIRRIIQEGEARQNQTV
jgi:hypothetical protein